MDRTLDDTFYLRFTTRAFATGIPGTLGGTPVVSAYEDASTTQITAGITLGVDHDSVTGLNLLTIVATTANGYETGKDYDLVITTGTVDSVSVVGEVIGHFSLGLDASFTRLGAPAGASVSADIAVIEGQTDDIGAAGAGLTAINLPNQTMDIVGDITGNLSGSVGSVTGAVGSVTGNVGGNVTGSVGSLAAQAKADVKAEADTALTDYDPPTNAEMEARTPTGAQLAYITAHAATAVPVTFSGGSTTTAIFTDTTGVDGADPSSVDDFYNGRILIFNADSLDIQATDITDYAGATRTCTITAVTTAVTGSHTAILV